jgi:hypothetical protein
VIVRIITYERSTLVNDEKYIGLDVHQAAVRLIVKACRDIEQLFLTGVNINARRCCRPNEIQNLEPKVAFKVKNLIGNRLR